MFDPLKRENESLEEKLNEYKECLKNSELKVEKEPLESQALVRESRGSNRIAT